LLIGWLATAGSAGLGTAWAVTSPKPLFTLSDQRLDELSGLAAGIRSPDVLYAQNDSGDSGDSARFFALDARSGRVRTEYAVPDATNHDWEDLAVARDAAGTPSVWLADTGDNQSERSEVEVYRVDEPRVGAGLGLSAQTTRPDVWRLRYPDGPHDAESLAIDPISHRIVIFTKSLFGQTEVFAAPLRPSATPATMTQIGSVGFTLTGTAGGPNIVGQLTATGASTSADGTLLAVRTYTDAYAWRLNGGSIGAALARPAVRIALPAQAQGEGIAIRGKQILIDSEQVGSPVFAVDLPASVLAAPSSSPRSSGPSSAASLGRPPASPSAIRSGAVRPGSTTGSGAAAGTHAHRTVTGTIAAAALAGVMIVALVATRRRRRR
jgi:hypothetical protein